jgi:Uma2 family endonuclease
MATLAPPRLLTTPELLALPEDGTDRYLIRGELRERPMTRRNRFHSRIEARIVGLLGMWLDRQAEPRGAVHSGEAGVILRHNPDTTVGIDVVYLSPELAAQEPEDTTQIDGVPTLAVEILSPSETQEEIDEKLDAYREANIPLVWLVDTHDQTVLVYRPGVAPELFNISQELTAEPHLPGFRTSVARIFSR